MLRTGPALVALLIAAALLVGGLVRTRPPGSNGSSGGDRSPEALAYVKTCATCHPAYDPRTHWKTEWRATVQSMHLRATDREIKIDPATLEAAIRYLEQNGR